MCLVPNLISSLTKYGRGKEVKISLLFVSIQTQNVCLSRLSPPEARLGGNAGKANKEKRKC